MDKVKPITDLDEFTENLYGLTIITQVRMHDDLDHRISWDERKAGIYAKCLDVNEGGWSPETWDFVDDMLLDAKMYYLQDGTQPPIVYYRLKAYVDRGRRL